MRFHYETQEDLKQVKTNFTLFLLQKNNKIVRRKTPLQVTHIGYF